MAAVTLSELRTRAKQRADRESSTFVADSEWLYYINEAISELHDILVTSFEDYLLSSATITTVNGQDTYPLPRDFYKERGVEYVASGLAYTLRPFLFRERNRYQLTPGFMIDARLWMRYQILGDNIRFVPRPDNSATLTLWYVPQAPKLVQDTDTLNVAIVSGWEKFIVASASAQALIKEEADPSAQLAEKAQTAQRITAAAKGRAGGEPQHISDVTTPELTWLWR